MPKPQARPAVMAWLTTGAGSGVRSTPQQARRNGQDRSLASSSMPPTLSRMCSTKKSCGMEAPRRRKQARPPRRRHARGQRLRETCPWATTTPTSVSVAQEAAERRATGPAEEPGEASPSSTGPPVRARRPHQGVRAGITGGSGRACPCPPMARTRSGPG